MLDQAEELEKQEKYEEALELLMYTTHNTQHTHPHTPTPTHIHPATALIAARQAERLFPYHPRAIARVGDCYQKMKQYDNAISQYEKVAAHAPSFSHKLIVRPYSLCPRVCQHLSRSAPVYMQKEIKIKHYSDMIKLSTWTPRYHPFAH